MMEEETRRNNNLDHEGGPHVKTQRPYLLSLHNKHSLNTDNDLREPRGSSEESKSISRQHPEENHESIRPRQNPIIPSPRDQTSTSLTQEQMVQDLGMESFIRDGHHFIQSEEGKYDVYIQNASSGRFVRRTFCMEENNAASDVDQNFTTHLNGPDDLNDHFNFSNRNPHQSHFNSAHTQISLALRFVQGILAGFSVASLYGIFTASTNEFALAHSQSANETSRFQFLANSFCFVGSMTELCSSRITARKTENYCLAVLYLSSLSIAIVAKHVEAKFIFSFGVDNPSDDWVDIANEDGSVESAVTTLRRLYIAQFIACVLGWVFVLHTREYKDPKQTPKQ